jgi:hypothetical protein
MLKNTTNSMLTTSVREGSIIMMATSEIRIISHDWNANRQIRRFIVEGELSNAKYHMMNRTSHRTEGTSFTEPRQHPQDYWIEMDEPTAHMVEALYQSPAIKELWLGQHELMVELYGFFLWSEVQDWILDCIRRRLGAEVGDASPGISRKAIGIHSYFSDRSAERFYTTAGLSPHGTLFDVQRSVTGRPLLPFEGRIGPTVERLVERLFDNGVIHKVSVDYTSLDVRYAGRIVAQIDEAREYVLRLLCEYFGWCKDEVDVDIYYRGDYNKLLLSSEHPIDQMVGETIA